MKLDLPAKQLTGITADEIPAGSIVRLVKVGNNYELEIRENRVPSALRHIPGITTADRIRDGITDMRQE